jgi:hypothetical protein
MDETRVPLPCAGNLVLRADRLARSSDGTKAMDVVRPGRRAPVSLAAALASLRLLDVSARRVGQSVHGQAELCRSADADAFTGQRCCDRRGVTALQFGFPSAFRLEWGRRHATRIPADQPLPGLLRPDDGHTIGMRPPSVPPARSMRKRSPRPQPFGEVALVNLGG